MTATAAQRSDIEEQPRAGGGSRTAPARRRRGPARTAAGQPPRTPLRLVAADGRVLRPASGEPVRTNPVTAPAPSQPAAEPRHAAERRPAAAAASPARTPAHIPVRLTRRGRLAVTAAAELVVASVSVVLAGAAQALGHSGAAARPGTAAFTKVQVQPGQSLWTLAEAYDPNADTRQVIQEIQQMNGMATDQVQPGQVLWMPRD